MHLKNLLLLASATISAITQYNNGLYQDVQYNNVPYNNFEDYSATSPK
ncbi:hypothetical protein VB005_08253, partial [Metarhizium brunneum]